MKTITISLSDKTVDETVTAEYFQIEDGWVTFKTDEGKAVVAYPEKRVTRIKSEEQAPQVVIRAHTSAGSTAAETLERVEQLTKERAIDAARWTGRA